MQNSDILSVNCICKVFTELLSYNIQKSTARPRFFLSQTLTWQLAKLLPFSTLKTQLDKFEASLSLEEEKRLAFYIKAAERQKLELPFKVNEFHSGKNSLQFLDIAPLIHRFPKQHTFNVSFGDITEVPEIPSFVKSRPIHGDNKNSVLLKLGSLRHFIFVKDCTPWEKKKNVAVWRGHAHNENRRHLIRENVNNAFVDARQIKKDYSDLPPHVQFMSIPEQLTHKFILSIEGHDVATNLKWAMRSNSLVLSPALKYETWFMEGKLIPGQHFVDLKNDFSDLNEKIDYYLSHPKEAKEIIAEANRYTEKFLNQRREKMMNLLVVHKYFKLYN